MAGSDIFSDSIHIRRLSPKVVGLAFCLLLLVAIIAVPWGIYAFVNSSVFLGADSVPLRSSVRGNGVQGTPESPVDNKIAPKSKMRDSLGQMKWSELIFPNDESGDAKNLFVQHPFKTAQMASVPNMPTQNRGAGYPQLEQDRERQEAIGMDTQTQPVIESGFECSRNLAWKCVSPTHLEVVIAGPGQRNLPLFRLSGVAGKTIRIDLKVDDGSISYWSSLNPVYTDAKSLSELGTYACTPASATDTCRSNNGSLLPSTDGQKWHFIKDVWQGDSDVLSFVETFQSDSVYISTRVPYPCSYNEAFFRKLGTSPYVKVVNVGRTVNGRSLLLALIGSGKSSPQQEKPCVLIYAGEHADEPDSMWAAQGGIQFLCGDTPEAEKIRNEVTFLVVPMLDPDAAAADQHEGMIASFMVATRTQESVAYANWFQAWISAGNRLDLIFDLHNIQSNWSKQISCALIEGMGIRGQLSGALNSKLIAMNQESNFEVMSRPWMRGWSPDRLGGWLSRRYGALCLAYELNSQAPDSHMNLRDLHMIGENFVRSASDFLVSDNGVQLMRNVNELRRERLKRFAQHKSAALASDAIEGETEISRGVGVATDAGGKSGELLVEKWVP
jgi:hypothetical protein